MCGKVPARATAAIVKLNKPTTYRDIVGIEECMRPHSAKNNRIGTQNKMTVTIKQARAALAADTKLVIMQADQFFS